MAFKQILNTGIVTLAIGLAAVLLAGCNRATADGAKQPAQPPVVTVSAVQPQEVTEWSEFTGRTDAVESVEVRPRVSGHIQEVRFQAGQLVKKGDVLFVIDPRWYKAESDRRQADLNQSKAHLANAERQAQRTARLLATKTVSTEDNDTSQSQYEEAKAAAQSAAALAESARLDLEYTEVRAPVDGRVSRAHLTQGNYVSGIAGSASLLTTLVSVDPVYVYVDVDENSLLAFNTLLHARQVSSGSNGDVKIPVELELADEEGFPHRGYIESFDNRVDPNTGTIVLRAVFANPDGRIVPGLFARIRVSASGSHKAFLVDESAIGTDQALKFVLTVGDKNKVEYRQVKLGPVIDGKRVVRSGLQAGEKIVVNGIQRARPGMEVTPQEQIADATKPAGQTAQR